MTRFPRPLTLALLFAVGLPAHAAGLLNDTGQTKCYGSNDEKVCDMVAGNSGAYPRQDARFGRDAKAAAGTLTKTGGGAAGFDFTALDASGVTTTTLGSHECVKDNVTTLIWSTESLTNKTWADAGTAASSYTRCGFSNGWRVPTRSELLSIVHYGTSNPAIDTSYFPGTTLSYYWSSDVYAPDPAVAWGVSFDNGYTGAGLKTLTAHVRLVRGGQ